MGAGVENSARWKLTGKLEYLHVDFGDISNNFPLIFMHPFIGNLSTNAD